MLKNYLKVMLPYILVIIGIVLFLVISWLQYILATLIPILLVFSNIIFQGVLMVILIFIIDNAHTFVGKLTEYLNYRLAKKKGVY